MSVAAAGRDLRSRSTVGRLATLAFLALLAATFAAFFVAQRIKQTPTVAQAVYLSRFLSTQKRPGVPPVARLGLLLKHADRVSVTIAQPGSGRSVRRLVRDRPVRAGETLRFAWDGRSDAGLVAPAGCYAVQVRLPRQRRAFSFSRWIGVDTTGPCLPPPLQ